MNTSGSGANGKNKQTKDQVKFREGEIVWAKVRGYSWWPAKIGKKESSGERCEGKFRVNFIGDKTYQDLPDDKIVDFISNFKEFSKIKKKDLQDAIDQARKLLSKDDQAALDRILREDEPGQKQMEKGGISQNNDGNQIDKNNSKPQKCGPAAKNGNHQNGENAKNDQGKSIVGSLNSSEQTSTPTKASVKDMSIQNSKSSKKTGDQEMVQTKDKTPTLNKRALKGLQKQESKEKKCRSVQSVGEASIDSDVEVKDDRSEIICTKSREGSSRNKRLKQTSKLENKVLNEICEPKVEQDDCSKQDAKVETALVIELEEVKMKIQNEDQDMSDKDQEEEEKEKDSEDVKSVQSIYKDLASIKQLDEIVTNVGQKKEQRKSAKQALKVIESVTTKQQKQPVLKQNKVEKRIIVDKPRTPQTKSCETSKSLGSLMRVNSTKNLNGQQPHQGKINNSSTVDSNKQSPSLATHQSQSAPSKPTKKTIQHQSTGSTSTLLPNLAHNQAISECNHISKTIKDIIRCQQQEEEKMRKQFELNEDQLDLLKNNGECLQKLKLQFPVISKLLLNLQKMEINLDILKDSGIGKTLKYLSDYCELYKDDIPQLEFMHRNINMILEKWKNYVKHYLFEEKACHFEDFQKEKYKQKVSLRKKKTVKTPRTHASQTNTNQQAHPTAEDISNQQIDLQLEQLKRQPSSNPAQLLLLATQHIIQEEASRSRLNSESYLKSMQNQQTEERQYSNPGTHESGTDNIQDNLTHQNSSGYQFLRGGHSGYSPNRNGLSAFHKPLPHQFINNQQIKAFSAEKINQQIQNIPAQLS